MDKILELSTQVSTPLILAGIVVSVLWGVFKLVIYKSPDWAKKDASRMVILVINWIGALSLINAIWWQGNTRNLAYEDAEWRGEATFTIFSGWQPNRGASTHRRPIILGL
jgi:hypothetical protein